MSDGFEYTFPAIQGVQAQREYYVSMCPMRLIPKIFLFNEDELVPEVRAQRQLNRARVPEIARYISGNPESYVFSAITASVDGAVSFEPLSEHDGGGRIGVLRIAMDARFIINDGQHRRAAIEMALRDRPELADETISVVFFLDPKLERCQQMFADLNRYAVRPSSSIGVLYDNRDEAALLTKRLVAKSPVFKDLVELERTTLSARSRRLFTLSAIHHATAALLSRIDIDDVHERVEKAVDFWETVAENMDEWQLVRNGKITAGEVRQDYINSHAVVLQALGRTGQTLLAQTRAALRKTLNPLRRIDWSRSNTSLWEGRAMVGGRVSKAQQSVLLTTNVIKQRLGLELSPEERRAEDALNAE